MLSWPKIKKQLIVFSLIFLISSLGIFVLGAKDAQAADPLGIVDGLKSIFGNVLLAIQGMVGVVVVWLASLGLGILNFTNPQNAKLVQEGWKVARDLANMFFVLILLAIAFATILRIETYGMKSLLPKLIIAALLINFSLVFAGVIIDFSGVMTAFFVSDGQVFFKDIASAMKLPKIMTTTAEEKGAGWQCIGDDDEKHDPPEPTLLECQTPSCALVNGTCQPVNTAAKVQTEADWKKLFAGDNYWAVISSLCFSIMFTVVAAFVFGALAFLLLGRILIIWFLLIIAPIAWLFWVLPATRHLFSQWWNTFIKWVFFAPAAFFFIWLSVKSWSQFISPSGGSAVGGVKQIVTDEMLGSQLVPQIMEPTNFVQFLLVCGMLLGSLIVAQKMGIHGAQGAIGVAKWFGKGAAGGVNRWLAGGGKVSKILGSGLLTKGLKKIGWEKGARGLEAIGRAKQKALPYVSPGVWKRGWTARREEAEREAFRLPAPALQDKLTRAFSLGNEKSDYLERAKRRERIEERKKIDTTNSEELTGGFKKAKEAGLGLKAAAYAQASAEQGDFNDLIREFGCDFNAEGISKFTEEQLVPLLGKQDAYRLGHDLNKSSEKAGQWQGRVFKANYDEKTGKTTYENLIKEEGVEEGTKAALGEANMAWSRMDPQERARFTHRTGFISESKDTPPKDLGIKGHEMWISGLPAEHAQRIPDEVIGTLMFRHSDETKALNPTLHEKLSEILTEKAKAPEQFAKMKKMIKDVAPGVETSSWNPEETEPSRTEPSRVVPPTKESFEEARTKAPPGAFG